jgi:hypothetical protein
MSFNIILPGIQEGSKVVPAFTSLCPEFCNVLYVRLQFHFGEY